MWVRVFGKGNVPLRVNLRVTIRIEDRLRAELIQTKNNKYDIDKFSGELKLVQVNGRGTYWQM